jgi:hypothetical protein
MTMANVKERPILFSGPMVRAILEGRKTVTRRLVKGRQIHTENTSIPPGDPLRWSAIAQLDRRYGFCVFGSTEEECAKELEEFAPCPYGKRGERLWVRETFSTLSAGEYEPVKPSQGSGQDVRFAATDPLSDCDVGVRGYPWRSSIHMPRWCSRILLEITAVRVKRLQDITEDQALAEGVEVWARDADPVLSQEYADDPKLAFVGLWTAVNGLASYNANPWVWVVEFKRV